MNMPCGLMGPVGVELAQPAGTVPAESAMPGGSVYELKFDGFRVAAVHGGCGVRLWSRNGVDLTTRFPEVAAGVRDQVPTGTVLDGEVVAWNGGCLDFDRLQGRLVMGAESIPDQARQHPASFVAFDVLARNGRDLRSLSWRRRREALDDLGVTWVPPLQLSPYTPRLAVARRWLTDYRTAGIEGLVVKGASTSYTPGKRGWVKVTRRDAHKVIIGAVIGPLTAPHVAVAVRLNREGQPVAVGRTAPLSATQSRWLARLLSPATRERPWQDGVSTEPFTGDRDGFAITQVKPVVVAEVTADAAHQSGRFRDPLQFVRCRPDLHPEDVPPVQ